MLLLTYDLGITLKEVERHWPNRRFKPFRRDAEIDPSAFEKRHVMMLVFVGR